jgi:ferredoxin-type protein NapH
MENKKLQPFMLWFLPLIVIGGLFFPVLGYLVLGMILFFLPLSFFKKRYWCWNLCPRGAFLDLALSKISRNKPVPKIFFKAWFRWLVFVLFMGFLVVRLFAVGKSWLAVGGVFVSMCVISTALALFLGITTKPRSWCMICPMGNLQEQIGKIKKG